jgi:hypothetical protein
VSQETTGLLFWTLSLYCLTKYIIIINKINSWYYAGFMITSLAAILSKESFILVLPASYIFYCLLYKEKYKTGFLTTSLHTWKTGLFLCLLTIAGLIAVLIFANDRATDTHCGLKPYIKALLYCYGISGGVVPALAGTFYLWRMKTNINNWLYPLLLFLLITVPQIILYAPSGIVDRYLMPAMTGCAFFAIYVYRKLKIEDSILNGKFWKNIGIGLGVAAIMGCSLIVFDNSIQQKIVNFAFRIQGEEWQNMTAVSSLQYLLNTVSTIAITGILTGIILVSWGCRRKNHSILKISQLYVGVLCLILILECGLAFASCRRYAMRGYATEGFLHTVIDNSTPGDLILVTGCPTIETEGLTKGFVTYMHKYDRKNLFIYPLARGPKEELAATDMIRFYNNKTIDEISNKHDIRIIAIFSGQEELFKKRAIWFDMKQYSRYEFAGNYVVYTKDEF